MKLSDLIQKAGREGGSVVLSRDCSPDEIELAKAEGRFAEDGHGNGHVLKPKE